MRCALALLFALFLSGVSYAADNPMTGKWDCISKDASSPEMRWTMVISEAGGKLSGVLNGGQDDIPLIEPKLEGDTFTFKIDVNPNCMVQGSVKVSGKKFDGTFGCTEAKGTFKGSKQL